MVDYEIFQKVAEKVQEHKENAFSSFGLKGDIRIIKPSELTSLMVRYKNPNYSEDLLTEIAKFMISESKDNRNIAIIGPQGIGKTTLISDLKESVETERMRGEFEYLKKLAIIEMIPFKLIIEEKFDLLNFFLKNQNENVILIFDDCNELFFQDENKKPSKELFDKLMRKLSNFQHSMFFFTFNAFGWKTASSRMIDFSSYFNNFFWLNGLSETDLKEAIHKRLNHFSINPISDNKDCFDSIFENQETINKIITYSSGNPRLTIRLLALSIQESFENKIKKINPKIVDVILEREGIKEYNIIQDKDLLNDKIISALLIDHFVSIKEISRLTGLNRTTIQRELENLILSGRVIKSKSEFNKKEFEYGLKKILKAFLERKLMEKIEKKTESQKLWSSDQVRV